MNTQTLPPDESQAPPRPAAAEKAADAPPPDVMLEVHSSIHQSQTDKKQAEAGLEPGA